MTIEPLLKLATTIFAIWSIPFLIILLKDVLNNRSKDNLVRYILILLFSILLTLSIWTALISSGLVGFLGLSSHNSSLFRSFFTSFGTFLTSLAFWKIHK